MNVRLSKEHKIKISGSSDIFAIMQKILLRENKIARDKEHFWVIGLAVNNKILYIELVSLGSVTETIVNPMEVFSLALQKKSPRVILVHNHPSKELKPSVSDKRITTKLVQGGKLVNITILDHLIISIDNYFSFADAGLLS